MKILIVDDDADLRELLRFALERAGYETVTATTAESALAEWKRAHPHLLLLDLNLPDGSGLKVLENVRTVSTAPVIVLTVRDGEMDVLRAFELGADDYVTKPFSHRQLLARIKAALKHTDRQERKYVTVGEVRLDLIRHQVSCVGRPPIHLSPLETRLLEVLMSAPDQVMGAADLLEKVWGYTGHLEDHALLKKLVSRVRHKIEPNPSVPTYIRVFLGAGYLFSAEGAKPRVRLAQTQERGLALRERSSQHS